MPLAERSVTNLFARDDEVLAARLGDPQHLRRQLSGQDRIVLALDGLPPDVGHEGLWVLRDCLSGTVLLARSLRRARPRIWPRCCARGSSPWACRWRA